VDYSVQIQYVVVGEKEKYFGMNGYPLKKYWISVSAVWGLSDP